jgi:hypothetical protein
VITAYSRKSQRRRKFGGLRRFSERAGGTPADAVDAGFSKAFVTIIDTRVTTLLSAALIYTPSIAPNV